MSSVKKPEVSSKIQGMYKRENLTSNLSQVVNNFDMSSRQIKEMVNLLRKLNGSKQALPEAPLPNQFQNLESLDDPSEMQFLPKPKAEQHFQDFAAIS